MNEYNFGVRIDSNRCLNCISRRSCTQDNDHYPRKNAVTFWTITTACDLHISRIPVIIFSTISIAPATTLRKIITTFTVASPAQFFSRTCHRTLLVEVEEYIRPLVKTWLWRMSSSIDSSSIPSSCHGYMDKIPARSCYRAQITVGDVVHPAIIVDNQLLNIDRHLKIGTVRTLYPGAVCLDLVDQWQFTFSNGQTLP